MEEIEIDGRLILKRVFKFEREEDKSFVVPHDGKIGLLL